MRDFVLLLTCVMVTMTGCQSGPRPAAGMAGVHVQVAAEPKAGRKIPGAQVAVYDVASSTQNQGAFELVDYSDLDDIVVWLEPADPKATAPLPPRLIEIDANHPSKDLLRPVSVGQKLVLRIHGRAAQDIYSVSDGNDFDLGTIPSGGEGSYTVKGAGLIEILSDSSQDPVARIYAAPSPWAAMTRSGEAVNFTNVPPGDYRLVSWHPRLPGGEQTIRLTSDHVTDASIKVGVNALPKVAPR